MLTFEETKESERLEALENLKLIYKEYGYLNFRIIEEKAKRSVNYYIRHFGNIEQIHNELGIEYKRGWNK